MVALPTDAMVFRETEFIGSFGLSPTDDDERFRMVKTGTFTPGLVVSETVSLDDVNGRSRR